MINHASNTNYRCVTLSLSTYIYIYIYIYLSAGDRDLQLPHRRDREAGRGDLGRRGRYYIISYYFMLCYMML